MKAASHISIVARCFSPGAKSSPLHCHFAVKIVQLTTDARDHDKNYDMAVPYFGTPVEALLQGFERFPDLEIHIVCCSRVHMSAPKKLSPNVFFHSLHVPKIGWMRTLYFGCIRAIRRKLREISPDIVHGQGTEHECAIAAALSGYPNVITIHGIMREQARLLRARPGSFYWLANFVESIALRRTAGVFCNSQYTEECIRPRTRRTWPVANPIRENFFRDLPALTPLKKNIFLNIGLVCPRKRQNELMAVARELHEEGLEFELHFLGTAGKNPYGVQFLKSVEQNRAFARYVGYKSTEELIRCLDGASSLVHVPTEESFGLVVAEALARNLKFFGFKVGGVTDIAQGVDGAEVFEDGDWNGLKNAMKTWIRHGAPRPVAANMAMQKRYHPDVIARQHREIYHEVLQASS